MPKRVQLSRRKGWRKPPNTVVVSRPSKWGNPFWKGTGCRMSAAHHYWCAVVRAQIQIKFGRRGGWQHFRWIAEHLHELRGKNLACWCSIEMPDSYCHAGKLLELANR